MCYSWSTNAHLFWVAPRDLSRITTKYFQGIPILIFYSYVFAPRLCLGQEECRERKIFGCFWREFQLLGGTCKISKHKVLESRCSSFKRWFILSLFSLVLCFECCKFFLIAVGLEYLCCYKFQRIWLWLGFIGNIELIMPAVDKWNKTSIMMMTVTTNVATWSDVELVSSTRVSVYACMFMYLKVWIPDQFMRMIYTIVLFSDVSWDRKITLHSLFQVTPLYR